MDPRLRSKNKRSQLGEYMNTFRKEGIYKHKSQKQGPVNFGYPALHLQFGQYAMNEQVMYNIHEYARDFFFLSFFQLLNLPLQVRKRSNCPEDKVKTSAKMSRVKVERSVR
jgi:hypothetical protein